MSVYTITIGNREYNVHLDGDCLKVNGKPVSGDLKPVNELGLHVLQRGKKAIELFFSSLDANNLEILVNGQRVLARVETTQRRASRQATKEDAGAIKAPMPGVLVSVPVQVGDEVEQGQTLVVLESMKMQMQLRAAHAGTVVAVLYKPGDQIEKGKEIVRIKQS